jgi:hypothetical protein
MIEPRDRTSHVVLLIQADDRVAQEIGSWISEDGNWVLNCSGPHAPTFECAGWERQRCVLAGAADVVVLDMQLESDAAMEGPPSWQLASMYRTAGTPVVALTDPDDAAAIIREEGVVILRRDPDRKTLLDAIRSLIEPQDVALAAAADAGF